MTVTTGAGTVEKVVSILREFTIYNRHNINIGSLHQQQKLDLVQITDVFT